MSHFLLEDKHFFEEKKIKEIGGKSIIDVGYTPPVARESMRQA